MNSNLKYGTQIKTPSGLVNVELLSIGDKVIVKRIKGMPDSSANAQLLAWNSSEIIGKDVVGYVEDLKLTTSQKLVRVNDLSITPEQLIMVLRDGIYSWKQARVILFGDYIGTKNAWVEVTVLEYINSAVNVVTFDVGPHEVYYADGVLVHNTQKPNR